MINQLLKLAKYYEYKLYSFANKQFDNLLEKYKHIADKINKLSNKYKNWLLSRYGENPSIIEIHPLEDAIVTLQKYAEKESGLSQKYKDSDFFKKLIDNKFPIETRKWINPGDVINITIDEMEDIIIISNRKKEKIKIEEKPKEEILSRIAKDKIGKVGEWNIWLPSSRENSIEIAQYDIDPVSGQKEERTTWCTARIYGSNLFYNYIGSSNGNLILFYIIRDNAQKLKDNDYLSLGFANGKPILEGQFGGVSVDRSNNGLTKARLKSILGGNYQPILDLIKAKAESIEGVSPALKEIKNAVKNVKLFENLIMGNSRQEKIDLVQQLLMLTDIDVEIIKKLIKDPELEIRMAVGWHLSREGSDFIPKHSGYTKEQISKFLDELSKDPSKEVRQIVASNDTDISEETLIYLSKDPDIDIRKEVYQNSLIPQILINNDFRNPNEEIRAAIARNTSTNKEVLEYFLKNDSSDFVKQCVILNKNLPTEIKNKYLFKLNTRLKEMMAGDELTDRKTLDLLADDIDPNIRKEVAKNDNVDLETLKKLTKDNDNSIREIAIKNYNKIKSYFDEAFTYNENYQD